MIPGLVFQLAYQVRLERLVEGHYIFPSKRPRRSTALSGIDLQVKAFASLNHINGSLKAVTATVLMDNSPGRLKLAHCSAQLLESICSFHANLTEKRRQATADAEAVSCLL